MSHSQLKAKTKSKGANRSSFHSEASHYRKPSIHAGQGAIYSAGPLLGISRKEISIGKSGDKYEKEADAASEKISSGQPAGMISRIANDEVRSQDIKKPEETPKPVQKQEESEEPVQTSKKGGGSGISMSHAASHAISNKGSGKSLSPSTKSALESGFGTGFSNVKVHDDSKAHEAADALSARAFTHGSDIWLGKGESQNDMKLMAHEAAHVVQQTGGVRRMVQSQKDLSGKGGKGKKPSLEGNTIKIPRLEIPDFKHKLLKKNKDVEIPRETERPKGKEAQRTVWGENVRNNVEKKLPIELGKFQGIVPDKGQKSVIKDAKQGNKDKIHFFEIGGNKNYLIGNANELVESFVFPRWDQNGQPKLLDADHKEEVQLGGDPSVNNLHLLDASANRSSGVTIQKAISKTIREAAEYLKIPLPPDAVRSKYKIIYQEIGSTGKSPKGFDAKWDKDEVEKVDPLKKLRPLNAKEASDLNLVGVPTRLTIYPLPSGGKPKQIEKWDISNKSNKIIENDWIKGFTKKSVEYKPGSTGKITGVVETRRMKKKGMEPKNVKWDLKEMGGIPFTTYIDSNSLSLSMQFAEFKMFSPIEFQTITIDDSKGLWAHGKLMPSLPLFKKLDLDITYDGGDLWISRTFTSDDFENPKPFRITEASLTLAVSPSAGFSIGGDVSFEIERIGKGSISAVKDSDEIELTGEFNFDTKLFDPAKIRMRYREGKFSGEGKIGIKEGKVKGIKSATITAMFGEGKFNASGTAELSIPGIKTVNMALSYSEKEGLAIGGSFELKEDIPGIKSGGGQALVKQRPDGKGYDITASGKAVPRIPGINSSIDITYENGAITIEGTAAYQKGMLNGSILVGVTNRPVSPDGKPAGEPGNKLIVYGGGTVTVKIAPWLQGTVGIKLEPNGEIVVAGTIALPDTLDIFPEKKLDKNIFKINLDIPIVGVAVLGQRIGIFATIGGGLDLSAGIGPGQLRDTAISITYNPAHEENTRVRGGAKLFIPAHAGLRLFVRGSLGAGIPIVSASAGLEVGGALGIEGAITAGVQMDWTPAKGLVLDAFGEIYAEPKFKFDITGFVMVEANLLLKTVELYSKRWQLAGFEYGSGLRFGVKFPIHYEERKPFDISMKDLQFEVPQIDKEQLLKDLIKRIA